MINELTSGRCGEATAQENEERCCRRGLLTGDRGQEKEGPFKKSEKTEFCASLFDKWREMNRSDPKKREKIRLQEDGNGGVEN